MLRYSFIYGGIIGVVVIALMTSTLMFLGPDSVGSSELAGYAFMLAILSLVFLGIKRFRDVEHGGVIKFTQAAAVGVGIAVVAGIFYTISWEAVLIATDYAFIDTYGASQISAIEAQGLAAADEAARIAEVREGMEMYRNPLFRFAITFVEIFPVGLIVALLSAAILRNSKVLPARSNA